ncbi:MAG: hypothetical protein RBT71_02505 [Flavobacteriales bacterium]|jgi:hypothetical protein|nr:hypothetical protein [Flavobacteriales bacterium]
MAHPLTPEQSLQVIESMIAQAKKSFSRASFYFLLWGVLLMAAMVATYLLRHVSPAFDHGAPWGIAGFLGGIISAAHSIRQGRREVVTSPMDRIIGWTWSAFVITMLLVIVCSVALKRDPGPMITVLTGLPTFLTGQIMRFRPLILGGILFWVVGVVMQFTGDPLIITVLYCTAMLLGYIVPGLLLKNRENGIRSA